MASRILASLHYGVGVFHEVVWSRWKASVMTAYGAVCLAEFVRDHWASDALRNQLHFIPNMTWQGWTIGGTSLLAVVAFEGAFRAIRRREVANENAKRDLEIIRKQTGAEAYEWSVDCFGNAADIKVLDQALSRYAVVLDVVITNRSSRRISLTAELLTQWAHPFLHNVSPCVEVPIREWDTILTAFDLSRKNHLLFPLTLDSGSVSGHIVFDIPVVGTGIGSLANEAIGGIRDDKEGERQREYKITVCDAITNETKTIVLSSVVAPRLDASGIVNATDLAVAGNASTFVLPAQLDNSSTEIVLLQRTVAELRDQNAALTAQVAVLLGSAPRRLTNRDKAIIANRLRTHVQLWMKGDHSPPMVHVLHGSGSDCGDLAKQLEEAFREGGFRVVTYSPGTSVPADDLHYGIWVRWDRTWCDQYSWPHDGPAIADAMKAAGLQPTLIERDGLFTSVIVGSRE